MKKPNTLERATHSKMGFARNQSELAAALDCTRQRIAHWIRRADAPRPSADGRHDVGLWRSYLGALGRLPISAGTAGKSAGEPRLNFTDGLLASTEAFGNAMPAAIRFALHHAGLKATPRQVDSVVFDNYMVTAAAVENVCEAWGITNGPLHPDDDGEMSHPDAIVQAAGRLCKTPRKPSSTPTAAK